MVSCSIYSALFLRCPPQKNPPTISVQKNTVYRCLYHCMVFSLPLTSFHGAKNSWKGGKHWEKGTGMKVLNTPFSRAIAQIKLVALIRVF